MSPHGESEERRKEYCRRETRREREKGKDIGRLTERKGGWGREAGRQGGRQGVREGWSDRERNNVVICRDCRTFSWCYDLLSLCVSLSVSHLISVSYAV